MTSPRRRSLLISVVLAFCAVARSSPATSPLPVFHVSGNAVSSRDGSHIPRCRLVLQSIAEGRRFPQRGSSTNPERVAVEADAQGHFDIPVPGAGRWQLSATARGFRSQMYEQHEQFSSAIVLTQAQPALEVTFKLDPDAILAGTVLDEVGDPVQGATVQVLGLSSLLPGAEPRQGRARLSSMTDDRGHYEISGLAPGDYKVFVQAQPWYAVAVQTRTHPVSDTSSVGALIDPSLDVIYPITWFRGVTDSANADVISIQAGETRGADFSLNPVPSTHLRLNASLSPPSSASGDGGVTPAVQIARLGPDGFTFTNVQTTVRPDRQIDVDGLSPGLYRLQTRTRPAQAEQITFLRVPGGNQTSIDATSAVEAARVNTQSEGVEDPGRIGVSLVDPSTGITFRSDGGQGGFRRRPSVTGEAANGPTLQVPEGTYQVVLSPGEQDVFLRGLVANGVSVPGRLITVRRGENLVRISVGTGHASVAGVATLDQKPAPGAMVLLVPASFGDPASIPVLRRDQTNTDGSFGISNVLPGQYILAIVDGGWRLDWHSPATLERYLLHGVPLSLKAGDEVHQNVAAQNVAGQVQ